MDIIILYDGLYHLVSVTAELVKGEVWEDCFDLCRIIREKFFFKKEVGVFYGCICN